MATMRDQVLDRSRQVAVQIRDILRERILSLELEPGQPVSRHTLQNEFTVSQTPVRDALLRLKEEGLIDIFPQYATRVSRIDISHARQAQFLRLSIEAEALRRLTVENSTATADQLDELIALQERFAEPETYGRFEDLDRAFHRVLYLQTGISRLWDVVRAQSVHLDRLRRLNLPMPGKLQSLIGDHKAIAQAVRRSDVEGAVSALREHLSGTLSIVHEIRTRFPDYLVDEAEQDRHVPSENADS
ncbi:GntR family transcriptional regulator [Rhizobium rhizoryzae]|uniref:DNA-binding GntR family transcriptional regulator n=1 Tax=Rhizobium rhizoryzae TaxID=451876 RepID=A0A7W6PQQ6_9HYPH|nr:GntR family transcriptional regulator [Rhizobium rhizoryzae]MBB4144430.1 DNA-binding GntR family transcriptional regulator [Rhizobium rhizoryzae]